jgi:hypothetical protein
MIAGASAAEVSQPSVFNGLFGPWLSAAPTLSVAGMHSLAEYCSANGMLGDRIGLAVDPAQRSSQLWRHSR